MRVEREQSYPTILDQLAHGWLPLEHALDPLPRRLHEHLQSHGLVQEAAVTILHGLERQAGPQVGAIPKHHAHVTGAVQQVLVTGTEGARVDRRGEVLEIDP